MTKTAIGEIGTAQAESAKRNCQGKYQETCADKGTDFILAEPFQKYRYR